MEGVTRGVYYCQQDRTQQLSDRLYQRNTTNAPIKMQYSIRAVPTKYVKMPILDCHPAASVPCERKPIYNTRDMFTPANSLPFNGYQAKIDTETILRDTIFPLQACPQAKYIPSSRSDMYHSSYLTKGGRPERMTNPLLFVEPTFGPFNPNLCHTGQLRFNNFTRQQIRALPFPYFSSAGLNPTNTSPSPHPVKPSKQKNAS